MPFYTTSDPLVATAWERYGREENERMTSMTHGLFSGEPFTDILGPEAEVSAIDSEILAGRNADALAKVSDKNVTRKEEIAAIRKVVEGNVTLSHQCRNRLDTYDRQQRDLMSRFANTDAYSTEGLRNRIASLEQWQHGRLLDFPVRNNGVPYWVVFVLFAASTILGVISPW